MQMDVENALAFIRDNKRVAIVGLSPKEDRPSNQVGRFLIDKGFNVVAINSGSEEILGQKCQKSLAELSPDEVDWIDLFVNPNRLDDLQEEVVRLSPKFVWCQIGVVNEAFNQRLEKEKIPYIADVCPKQVWKKLISEK